ncbi:hypothetical protein ACFYY2_23175 [Streptomyces sp. NPDC001822]|uniref:hypothetical protein n=1 Tax=Streptomyces sp. NPDC001822 TaxID=3364614 RepID=UPI0036C86E12
MTACAIEINTTGAARAAATTEPGPGPVEAAAPAESETPRAAGTSDEGADPLRVGASDDGPGDGDAPGPAVGSAASTRPVGYSAPGGTDGRGVPDASAGVPAPPRPPVPPVPAFPPGRPGGAAEAVGASPRTVPPVLTIAADRSYAARLTAADPEAADPAWFPERWTLGPEPYAVPLPLGQPEEADSDVLPLSDGRVLIRRRVADRHAFSLLYPTGPATGEVPLGALECEELTLLPPPPDGMSAYALVPGDRSTGVWLVAGGPFGPEHVADVAGHCSGGAWLDREGRLLALDRQLPGGGPVKAVAVDLERGGEVTPLLQIAPDSDDRLLLADADSGLLLIRSDAPGHDRLGWGVLGSCLPVRFPECLHPADVAVTPIAVQPGQMLMPENCAVALRLDGPGGSWVGLWRPAGRRVHHVAAPDGWLAGAGFWSREGLLHLPYAQPGAPCGVAVAQAPAEEPHRAAATGAQPSAAPAPPGVCKPVPLGQAPLTGSTAAG